MPGDKKKKEKEDTPKKTYFSCKIKSIITGTSLRPKLQTAKALSNQNRQVS